MQISMPPAATSCHQLSLVLEVSHSQASSAGILGDGNLRGFNGTGALVPAGGLRCGDDAFGIVWGCLKTYEPWHHILGVVTG